MEKVTPYAKIVDPVVFWMSVAKADFRTYEDLANMQPEKVEHLSGARSLGIQMLKKIEKYARVSHRSEDHVTENSWIRFLEVVLMQRGDWSVAEHGNVTVEFLVDRGITHELVRHRHFSFTQESTRFVNYTKEGHPPQFVEPPQMYPADAQDWTNAVNFSENKYKHLVIRKVSPQIARSVLPNALASLLIMTGNLRSWRHFLLMRTTKEAHPQMREVTIPLLASFQEMFPILFDDIQVGQRQIDNMKLPR